mgnify:CR=1 FL=1
MLCGPQNYDKKKGDAIRLVNEIVFFAQYIGTEFLTKVMLTEWERCTISILSRKNLDKDGIRHLIITVIIKEMDIFVLMGKMFWRQKLQRKGIIIGGCYVRRQLVMR